MKELLSLAHRRPGAAPRRGALDERDPGREAAAGGRVRPRGGAENPDYKGKYILVTPKKPFKEAYEQMMNSPYVGANSGTMMAQQFMNAEKLTVHYFDA